MSPTEWPTELQGPSTNRIEVRVSDGAAGSNAQFLVTVLNTAPDFSVSIGQTELEAGRDRAVLRGPQPILENDPVADSLTILGNPGDVLRLEHRATLSPDSSWETIGDVPMDANRRTLDRSQVDVASGYLRATRKVP